jgi:hypothetical protein
VMAKAHIAFWQGELKTVSEIWLAVKQLVNNLWLEDFSDGWWVECNRSISAVG